MSSSSAGPPLPTLIVTGGASDGLTVQLEAPGAEKTIGSAPTAHVRLTTRNVDAQHARVAWEEGAVVLSDEGSGAGTFVNGEKITSGHVLSDGDRISVGPPGSPESVRLLVRVPPDLASAGAGMAVGLAPRTAEHPRYVPPAAVPPPASDEPILFTEEPVNPLDAPAFIAPEPPPSAPSGPAIVFEEAPAPASPAVSAAPSRAAASPHAASPPAASAPAPSKPPAPAPPVRSPKPSPRPDYLTEAPSIGGDRVREVVALPAAAPAPSPRVVKKRRRAPPPSVQRLAIVGGGAAVLSAVAFYGWSHFHQPPPVLSSITPPKAEAGTTVTIAGTGFAAGAGANSVRFGDAEGTVTNASATTLAVTVPAIPTNVKEVPVTVSSGGGRSNALFVKIARLPRLTRMEPDVALPGTELTLHGQNLDGAPVTVRVGGEKVVPLEAHGDSLRVKVPEMAWTEGQTVAVTIDVGPDAARPIPLMMGHLPIVQEVSPESGLVGERITVKGRGFDPVATGNRLTVGGVPALVLSASATEMRAAVPAVPAAGAQTPLPVVVEARGSTSGAHATFALTRSLSGLLRLRFFPAPAPQGPPDKYAFVCTEIAPVLVLTGKADAASTAERADRVAAALTSAMEGAAARPVAFEVREGAAPAVAVTGGAVVVTATPDDVDGYAQPWEPGVKPARVTPRQIAGYWAAVLQDYVTLFGEGQRPSRVAEVSSRGRVLVDVYSEAQRRGAAGGVPVATAYELSPAVLKTLREIALAVPAGGGASGTAVAGRWEGTMAEEAELEHPIEVQLQVEDGKLGGSLTTKSGTLAVRTPLQQVSYDKGLLRFSTSAGGAPRHFRGTLAGDTLSGSIFKDAAAKDKDAVGRFNLRYVE